MVAICLHEKVWLVFLHTVLYINLSVHISVLSLNIYIVQRGTRCDILMILSLSYFNVFETDMYKKTKTEMHILS